MKFTVSASLIKGIESVITKINKEYKDNIPKYESFSDDHTINLTPCNRKWGNITVDGETYIIEIKDTFILDILNWYSVLYIKLIPIINVALSMIPMFKSYTHDLMDSFNSILEKYTEEYEYTVCKVVHPAVKIGYVVMKRVKGETSVKCVNSRIILIDEMDELSSSVGQTIMNEAAEKTVKLVNANPHVKTPVYNTIDEAMAVIDELINLYYKEMYKEFTEDSES